MIGFILNLALVLYVAPSGWILYNRLIRMVDAIARRTDTEDLDARSEVNRAILHSFSWPRRLHQAFRRNGE